MTVYRYSSKQIASAIGVRQCYFGQMRRSLKETIIPVPAPFDGAKAKLLNIKLVKSKM